jgi:hypothetical protein
VKVGDVVKWTWHPKPMLAHTDFTGLVVTVEIADTLTGLKIRVFDVLDNTGQLTRVREDESTLELIHESR